MHAINTFSGRHFAEHTIRSSCGVTVKRYFAAFFDRCIRRHTLLITFYRSLYRTEINIKIAKYGNRSSTIPAKRSRFNSMHTWHTIQKGFSDYCDLTECSSLDIRINSLFLQWIQSANKWATYSFNTALHTVSIVILVYSNNYYLVKFRTVTEYTNGQ